jgi:hypothetical protein
MMFVVSHALNPPNPAYFRAFLGRVFAKSHSQHVVLLMVAFIMLSWFGYSFCSLVLNHACQTLHSFVHCIVRFVHLQAQPTGQTRAFVSHGVLGMCSHMGARLC